LLDHHVCVDARFHRAPGEVLALRRSLHADARAGRGLAGGTLRAPGGAPAGDCRPGDGGDLRCEHLRRIPARAGCSPGRVRAARLPPEIRRLRERTKLEPISLSDVPERLTRAFVEKDGHRGRVVLVFPTLTTDSSNGRAQIQHTRAVREAAWKVDPQALVAGQIVLTTDIEQAITDDGMLTALMSFL